VENYYYSVRKNVFEYDDVMNTQRQIVYELRRRCLLDNDENIKSTMMEFSDRNMDDFVDGHISEKKPTEDWLFDKLAENTKIYCSMLEAVTPAKLQENAGAGGANGKEAIKEFLRKEARVCFENKTDVIEESGPGLAGIVSRQILLQQLDSFWQQHLKNMDFMKTSVTLRAYGQKNPLTEYKLEGYQVFLKMMSRIRRNAVYNMFLFTPRKLSPMSNERIKSLIPSREQRRKTLQEAAKQQAIGTKKVPLSITVMGSGNVQSINLAKLALNVRQLLDARKELQDLALASFGELKDQFNRAGLVMQGDQIRWASACTDFELFEDDLTGELYIGLKERAASAPDDGQALQARQAIRDAMNNPEFMKSIDQFATRPEDFLAQMQAAAGEQSWSAADVAKMRETYRAAGIDLDQMLKQMTESTDDMPPAQREVVEYMSKLLSKDGGGREPEAVPKSTEEETKQEVNA